MRCIVERDVHDVHEDAWRDDGSRAGHLLESFIVQQVTTQAGWTDGDLRFHHYRDGTSS